MIDLRVPTLEDARELVEAVRESSEELRPWMPWASGDYGLDEAMAWIEKATAERQAGTAFEFVFSDGEGRLLGVCGVNRIQPENRLANLGYWIRTSASGRGITVEVVRKFSALVFANTELHRLEIVVAVENVRSQRVAEKAGAVREGVMKGRLWLYEVPHDAVVYSIVRADGSG